MESNFLSCPHIPCATMMTADYIGGIAVAVKMEGTAWSCSYFVLCSSGVSSALVRRACVGVVAFCYICSFLMHCVVYAVIELPSLTITVQCPFVSMFFLEKNLS